MSKVLTDGDNSEETILSIATEQWLNSETVKACYDNGETKNLVAEKFNVWKDIFWITGTPGNVLINNVTREYKIVSWAYPSSEFIKTVNELLGR